MPGVTSNSRRRGAPTFSTVVRTVHAALIGGPHLSWFCAGAEQRRDCAGWLRPAVANALPALATEPAIQLAIRPPATYAVYGPDDAVTHDDVRLPRLDRHG
jgi:hypothetical protein